MSKGRTRVGVFHPGTQHSWQTALAFQESGQLAWYATSVFYDPGRWPYRLERYAPRSVAERLHRNFSRRHSPALDPGRVRQFGLWEWVETGARRAGARRLSRWANRRGNESFGRLIADLAEREPVDVLWGYNTSSLEAFRWAKPRGIRCILDQTIGHPAAMNRVMLAEHERHPEFFLASYRPFTKEEIAQQDEEIALADVVVVGSRFCAGTLTEHGCPADKIRLLPYGYDETLFPIERPTRAPLRDRPIEFLFVGAIHPRKGIAALLESFADVPAQEARLALVGSLEVPAEAFRRYGSRVIRIPSVPRKEVVKHFLRADCFIFPSLFEGSALVLYEAIGAGLGLIQTASAGEGVQGNRNGEIVADISKKGLRTALGSILGDPSRLAAWQAASWGIREEYTWRRYRGRVRELLEA